MRYRGSQKFIAPFVHGCISRCIRLGLNSNVGMLTYELPRLPDKYAAAILEEVIFDVSAETTILRRTISALLAASINNELEPAVVYITRQLLSTLHQRQPVLVKEQCEKLLGENGSQKGALEQLQIAISLASQPLFRLTPCSTILPGVVRGEGPWFSCIGSRPGVKQY